MPILTDKPCPECGLDLEERLDPVRVFLQWPGRQSQANDQSAREFRCLRGHVWLLVKV